MSSISNYQYKTISFKPKGSGFVKLALDIKEVDKVLNELGKEGWRVVASYPVELNGYTGGVYYTLMREVASEQENPYTTY